LAEIKSEGKYNFAIANGNKAGQAVSCFEGFIAFSEKCHP
jgi:hypothetical protein